MTRAKAALVAPVPPPLIAAVPYPGFEELPFETSGTPLVELGEMAVIAELPFPT